jgi:autotransporter-associated beta strand protein
MSPTLHHSSIAQRLSLARVSLALIFTASLQAQSIWDGGGVNADFLNAVNWTGDTAPTSATTTQIQFAGSVNTSPVLNSDLQVGTITFNSGASAFSVSGTGLISLDGAGSAGVNSNNQGIINNSSSLQTISNAIKLTGNSIFTAASGSITLEGNVDTNGKQLQLRAMSNGLTLELDGIISGSGGLVLRGPNNGNASTSIIRLGGANSFSGGIQLWGSNLRLANDSALGSAANTLLVGQSSLTDPISVLTEGNRTIAQSIRLTSKAVSGAYTIGGSDAATSTYSGTITVNTTSSTANSQAAMPLIVTAASGGRVNFTGGIIRDSASTGTGDTLIKSGAGIVALSGTTTYSGTTTVNAGTLLINGSLSNGGAAVTVADSAALGGSGTINRDVSVLDGATFTPGDFNSSSVSQAGTLTVNGALAFANTSILNFDLGSSSDLVAVSGNLTLDGVLNITAGSGFGVGTYELFSFTGTLFNNTLTLGTLPSGFTYALDFSTANQVNLTVSAVPEPATAAMILGVVALGAVACTRRRRTQPMAS